MILIIAFSNDFSKAIATNKDFDDYGLISIMYHRFNETKYPSTNIQLDVFKEQLNIIEEEGIKKENLDLSSDSAHLGTSG